MTQIGGKMTTDKKLKIVMVLLIILVALAVYMMVHAGEQPLIVRGSGAGGGFGKGLMSLFGF